MTMTWKNGRQLATLQDSNNTISYEYDSDSVRTSKTVDGIKYTYAYLNGMLMHETRGESKFYYSYDANGILYSVKYTLTDNSQIQTYYFTHNIQGDIIGIYDSNGTQQVKYEYDAWGNILSVTDSQGNTITDQNHIGHLNPFRYRGYYYDNETGLYYLMSRYYDPVTHRFINADGYFQAGGSILDTNMSAYCGNNPIMRADPTGEFWDIVFDIASICLGIADVISNPSNGWAWAGLVTDVACAVIPFATGGGVAVKAATKADKIADTANTTKKITNTVDNTSTGWKVGDDITNLTKAGNTPSWSTVRQRYWKNETLKKPPIFSEPNIERMKKGLAPQVLGDNGKLYSMELHHKTPRRDGGTDAFDNLQPLAPWDHDAIDSFRHFKP